MKKLLCFCLICAVLVGCASEDESIVNPPPGTSRVVVRFFNLVPDAQPRKLVMEQGFQTALVLPGMLSATVQSPGDSSLLQVFTGSTASFTTEKRQQFTRNSVYDVYAIASPKSPLVLDTVFVSNANASLLTLPVAQVRVTNTIPDSTRSFDVRLGCPNGTALTISSVPYAQSSLYREVLPGNAVFSVLEQRVVNGVPTNTVLGTYEAQLQERGAYAIIMYQDASGDASRIMFVAQEDTTANATRAFTPVSARDAFVRVINLHGSAATVSLPSAGTELVRGLSTGAISGYTTVGTCKSDAADVFQVQYADGKTSTDSVALTVRGRYTVLTTDSADQARAIIVPPLQRPFGSTGKAVVRIIHASPTAGSLVVSVGSRTTATTGSAIAPGQTLARDVRFDSYSTPVIVQPGTLPITITTARTPTTIIETTQTAVEAEKSYDLIVYNDGSTVRTALVQETEENSTASPLPKGIFLRYVNAAASSPSLATTINPVIQNGTVFYRDQITTVVAEGNTTISSGTVSTNISTNPQERTLVIFAEGGLGPSHLEFKNIPFEPTQGVLQRRVINATQDVN